MVKGREIKTFTVNEAGIPKVMLSLIHEVETGLYFAIDASYLEQAVGPVASPFQNGTVIFDDGVEDGAIYSPDVICEQYGGEQGEHPKYPCQDWMLEVKNGDTRLGYWAWVSDLLNHQNDILFSNTLKFKKAN